MSAPQFVPLPERHDPGRPPEEAAADFYEVLRKRRSIRAFSDRAVSRETMEWVVRAAGTAPSGANRQPWRFVCVEDPELKRRIRHAAEEEEHLFYTKRASRRWLDDLAPIGTDENKEYLEVAPWVVVLMRLAKTDAGEHVYYGQESVGIALGTFLTAAHFAGLATLTHTPNPMRFLREVLGRPAHEHPFALIPVGYPADAVEVPAEALRKRSLDEVMVVPRAADLPEAPAAPR